MNTQTQTELIPVSVIGDYSDVFAEIRAKRNALRSASMPQTPGLSTAIQSTAFDSGAHYTLDDAKAGISNAAATSIRGSIERMSHLRDVGRGHFAEKVLHTDQPADVVDVTARTISDIQSSPPSS